MTPTTGPVTVHPNDRDWDHLDALVDVDPIALRDAAWRLAVALDAAEHRADEAEVKAEALREAADAIDVNLGRGYTGADDHNATAAAAVWLRTRADQIEKENPR